MIAETVWATIVEAHKYTVTGVKNGFGNFFGEGEFRITVTEVGI